MMRLEGGGGSDSKRGRMFEGEWHCNRHGNRKVSKVCKAKGKGKGKGK